MRHELRALGLAVGLALAVLPAADAATITEFPVTPGSEPGGIIAGPDGYLWFGERFGNRVGKITTDGVVTELSAGSGSWWLAEGPDGNLWFTEPDDADTIGRVTPAGVVTEFTAGITDGALTNRIAAGSDGNLWFTELAGNRIGRITIAGVVTEFPLPALVNPLDITAGPDGNLWFTSPGTNQIGNITPAGVVTLYPLPTPAAGPHSITVGRDGNLWFTESDANRIGRITPAGVVTEFTIPTAGAGPAGITAGPDGNVWFAERLGNKIGRIIPAGAIVEFGAGITAGAGPYGIAVGPDGNIWFTEREGNRIGRLSGEDGLGLVVNTLADGPPANDGLCTLREAIINTNNYNQSGSTDCAVGLFEIRFSVTGRIALTSALPTIKRGMSILGPGAEKLEVSRESGGDYSVFEVATILGDSLPATLHGLTISNGRVYEGGGVLVRSPTTISECVIDGNEATHWGGGVMVLDSKLVVTNSTLSGNRAGGGAALFTWGSSTATLRNTTIGGNTGNVAVVALDEGGLPTQVALTNVTISHADGNVLLGIDDGGATPQLTVENTILVGGSSPTIGTTGAFVITSLGHNLATDGAGGLLTGPGDLIHTEPRLGPLGRFGGGLPTRPLLPGSPAIDAGSAVGTPLTDQRGYPRGWNGKGWGVAGVDIGAYEVNAIYVDVLAGNDANSGASLAVPVKTVAHAIDIASTGHDLILAPGTYPESGLLIGESINLMGTAAATTVVDGNDLARVFSVSASAVEVGMCELTITGGRDTLANGGGVRNFATLTLARSAVVDNAAVGHSGGGVGSFGPLFVIDSSISGNQADGGAGIAVQEAPFVVAGSTISGNQTSFDGALAFTSSVAVKGVVRNSTISGNTATMGMPGGLWVGSTLTHPVRLLVDSSTIAANHTSGPVGGINVSEYFPGTALVELRNSVISGNDGAQLGGLGVFIASHGGNLTSDGGAGFLTGPADLTNIDPLLGPLAANGGPTLTHLPQASGPASPAIDSGVAGAPPIDQRGIARPIGSAVDRGAVEVAAGGCPAIAIGPWTLPRSGAGAPYDQQLTASGGAGPYVFSVASGSLPPGWGLTSTGALVGTAASQGAYSFAVTAMDRNGCSGTQPLTAFVAATACAPAGDRPLQVEQTASGRLIPGECGEGDYYSFTCSAGAQVSIALDSVDYATYLVLLGPSGSSIAEDYGSGGGLNSRIPATGLLTLPAHGTYRIAATSLDVGASGSYALTLDGLADACGLFDDGFEAPPACPWSASSGGDGSCP